MELINLLFDNLSNPAISPLKSLVHVNEYASLQDAHAVGLSLGNSGAEKSHGDKNNSPPFVTEEEEGTAAAVIGKFSGVESPHNFIILTILIVVVRNH